MNFMGDHSFKESFYSGLLLHANEELFYFSRVCHNQLTKFKQNWSCGW